jgi:tRNA pseudouridine13 synthase
LDLPSAYGPPAAGGRIRAVPEDFVVDELLGFELDGAGTHAWLAVEKRGANTAWVAGQIARAAGVAVREVGYSGHKDRHAVTRQWFSIPWPCDAPLDACAGIAGEGFRVLSVARHGRKLRPGSHRANRFDLRVRDITGDTAALESRLRIIGARGLPNYFGPQRFGRDAANLARARDWATGGPAPRDRGDRGFALSSARSEIFNLVAACRVRQGNWDRVLPGEAVMLDGRRSFFHVDDVDAALEARSASHDVHPTGPLWGRGTSPATSRALEVETDALAEERDLCGLLESQGLEHERRSLRVPVRALTWSLQSDVLALSFELPRGAFATAVLHELLQDRVEAGAAT